MQHKAAGNLLSHIPYSLLLTPPRALHFPKEGDDYGTKIIKLCFLIHPSILSI